MEKKNDQHDEEEEEELSQIQLKKKEGKKQEQDLACSKSSRDALSRRHSSSQRLRDLTLKQNERPLINCHLLSRMLLLSHQTIKEKSIEIMYENESNSHLPSTMS